MVGAATEAENFWSRRSTLLRINSNEDNSNLVPQRLLIQLNFVLDHFSVDPAIAPINTTGRELATICRSICADKTAQFSDLLMENK